MQSPAAPPTISGGVDVIVALVIATSTLVGTLGGLVTGILAYIKSHTNSKDVEVNEGKVHLNYDKMMDISKLVTTFAQKTTEQESKIKSLAEVITEAHPAVKDLLATKQLEIEKLTRDVKVAQDQLNVLKPLIPKEGQADFVQGLPR
jgi:NH3-dependent NAD+ synthetase